MTKEKPIMYSETGCSESINPSVKLTSTNWQTHFFNVLKVLQLLQRMELSEGPLLLLNELQQASSTLPEVALSP